MRSRRLGILIAVAAMVTATVALIPGTAAGGSAKAGPPLDVRFATFNASLNRFDAGDLIADLSTPDDAQARAVAEIIQRVRPEVLLVNEFDFDPAGEAARLFKEFRYQTRKSWSRERRVIGKAEYWAKGENPRFVVTSLSADEVDARTLYEEYYCARGEMENRIKKEQLYLFLIKHHLSKTRLV
mgnify:CR=1 FL=1